MVPSKRPLQTPEFKVLLLIDSLCDIMGQHFLEEKGSIDSQLRSTGSLEEHRAPARDWGAGGWGVSALGGGAG